MVNLSSTIVIYNQADSQVGTSLQKICLLFWALVVIAYIMYYFT